jgi:hypothetical protein
MRRVRWARVVSLLALIACAALAWRVRELEQELCETRLLLDAEIACAELDADDGEDIREAEAPVREADLRLERAITQLTDDDALDDAHVRLAWRLLVEGPR